jgi:ABC-type transporter Mla subunit MlaD
MAAGVEIRDDIVRARLDRLLELIDQVDTMTGDLDRIREQQAAAWPQIPSVRLFAARLEHAIDAGSAEATAIRGTIGDLRQALADSVRSLHDLDQDVQDRLQRIAARLEPTDPVPPTPTTGRRHGLTAEAVGLATPTPVPTPREPV